MKDDMPSEDDSDSEDEYGGMPKFTQIGTKPSALSKVQMKEPSGNYSNSGKISNLSAQRPPRDEPTRNDAYPGAA